MEILGVGPLEFILVLLLALILLGPEEMANGARKAARAVRRFTQSTFWADTRGTIREIQELPNQLLREAGLEEELKKTRESLGTIQPDGWAPKPYTPPPAPAVLGPTPPPATPEPAPAEAETTPPAAPAPDAPTDESQPPTAA